LPAKRLRNWGLRVSDEKAADYWYMKSKQLQSQLSAKEAEIVKLREELKELNKNCISIGLHESRVSALEHRIEKIKENEKCLGDLFNDKNKECAELKVKLNTCKNDYWFMTNLLEKYSFNKEEAIKDCIYRMNFRKPLFNILDEK